MADPKKNPLIGAFRAPVPGAPPGTPAPPEAGKPPAAGAAKPIDEKKGQEAPKAPAGTTPKPTDGKKGPEAPKASADTSAKPADGKKEPEAPKAPADPLTKPTNEKKGPEAPKAPADTPAKPTNEKKGQEEPKAPTDASAKPADGKKSPVSDPSKPKDEKEQEPRSPDLRFVALSKIKPLPGTYVKDEPRKDYSGLIADIKKNGLQKPVILRKSEKEDEFQLVDGFHRCKALEQAGMLEVRADVYEMSLAQASEYRKGHRDKPLMPVPGKLVPYPPEEPAKADKAPEAPAVGDEELPENLKIPLTKEGQPETVTTMKVANIRPFEGHPFAVRDNKESLRPPVHGGVPAYPKGRGKTLFRQRHPSPRLYGGGFPGRTGGGNAFLSGGRPGPAGGAAVLRPSRHTTRGGADYGTEAAYHALESAPKPGECSKAGDHPERAQETAPPENDPGTVTAALAPLSAPAWHFDSKMPLVRGSAPDTPAPPKVPSI